MSDPTDEEKAKARELLDKLARLPDDLARAPEFVRLRERQAAQIAQVLAESRVNALEEAAQLAAEASRLASQPDDAKLFWELSRRIRALKGNP